MAVSRAIPAVTCLRRSQSSRVSLCIAGMSLGFGGGRAAGRESVSESGVCSLLRGMVGEVGCIFTRPGGENCAI